MILPLSDDPGGHWLHSTLSISTDPAWHESHWDALPADMVPGKHRKHAYDPDSSLCVPGRQPVHAELPVSLANVPGEHSKHDALPVVFTNSPRLHG